MPDKFLPAFDHDLGLFLPQSSCGTKWFFHDLFLPPQTPFQRFNSSVLFFSPKIIVLGVNVSHQFRTTKFL